MSVAAYIASKEGAWMPLTLQKERHRLNAIVSEIDGDPARLWKFLEAYAPYARLTYWTRAAQYYQFLIGPDKENPYEQWRKANARRFSGVYERQAPSISYDEARERINRIPCTRIQEKALELLGSGMRWTESHTLERGRVTGKGGRRRKVYFSGEARRRGQGNTAGPSYQSFYTALKKVGLKPHDLRKLYAARLVERGANVFQLCRAMGWSNLNTAQSYVQAKDEDIQGLVE